eukprot:GHVU01158493.1.p3 GENE.GHVU01158493.1~~GHVU01158493.1.p3  ORF type:complete len:141 (+),score=6.04 GHVU01158493.1:1768-2190(+)
MAARYPGSDSRARAATVCLESPPVVTTERKGSSTRKAGSAKRKSWGDAKYYEIQKVGQLAREDEKEVSAFISSLSLKQSIYLLSTVPTSGCAYIREDGLCGSSPSRNHLFSAQSESKTKHPLSARTPHERRTSLYFFAFI